MKKTNKLLALFLTLAMVVSMFTVFAVVSTDAASVNVLTGGSLDDADDVSTYLAPIGNTTLSVESVEGASNGKAVLVSREKDTTEPYNNKGNNVRIVVPADCLTAGAIYTEMSFRIRAKEKKPLNDMRINNAAGSFANYFGGVYHFGLGEKTKADFGVTSVHSDTRCPSSGPAWFTVKVPIKAGGFVCDGTAFSFEVVAGMNNPDWYDGKDGDTVLQAYPVHQYSGIASDYINADGWDFYLDDIQLIAQNPAEPVSNVFKNGSFASVSDLAAVASLYDTTAVRTGTVSIVDVADAPDGDGKALLFNRDEAGDKHGKFVGVQITIPKANITPGWYQELSFYVKGGSDVGLAPVYNNQRVLWSENSFGSVQTTFGTGTKGANTTAHVISTNTWGKVTVKSGSFYLDGSKDLRIRIHGLYDDPNRANSLTHNLSTHPNDGCVGAWNGDLDFLNADGGALMFDKVQLIPLKSAEVTAAKKLELEKVGIDYTNNTMTVKVIPTPASADLSALTWNNTGVTGTPTVNGNQYTFALDGIASFQASMGNVVSNTLSSASMIVFDFADNDTYRMHPSKTSYNGDTEGSNDPTYGWQGYGVWEDGETLVIKYQKTLQNEMPDGTNGVFSHYLAKVKPNTATVGDAEDFSFMIVEYRAKTSSTGVTMKFAPDNDRGHPVIDSALDTSGNLAYSATFALTETAKTRLANNSHCSVWFEDEAEDSVYEITRILFFASEADANGYKSATLPADRLVLSADVDYNTNTVTLDAFVGPANASNKTVTYALTNNPAGAVLSGNTVSFSKVGGVTIQATSGELRTSVDIVLNDKKVMDFTDDSTYVMYTEETAGTNGDGNNGVYGPYGYTGYGVWEVDGALKISYQDKFQFSAADGSGGRTANGHYQAKVKFPADDDFTRAYEYVMVEYRAKTTDANINIYYTSDGNPSGSATWNNINVDGKWHMTEPKSIGGFAQRLENMHGSICFTGGTDTNATYEVARILYFRSLADAQGYYDIVVAGQNNWVENMTLYMTGRTYVNAPAEAQIHATVYPIAGNQTVTYSFANAADAEIASLTFDGKLSFKKAGSVTVRVTGAAGFYKDFVVDSSVKPNATSEIIASATTVDMGDSVDFGASLLDINPTSLTWTVVQGGKVLATASTKLFSYIFREEGAYTVTLAVVGTNADGDAYSATHTVTVNVVNKSAMDAWMVTVAMNELMKNSTYKVIFRDADGKVISEQSVKYGASAKVPTYGLDYELPLDKVMTGWSDESFNYVTKDIDTKMILVDEKDFNLDAVLAGKRSNP